MTIHDRVCLLAKRFERLERIEDIDVSVTETMIGDAIREALKDAEKKVRGLDPLSKTPEGALQEAADLIYKMLE